MFASTILGLSLSIVALGTLVTGDPGSILIINNVKITNNPNDYFDAWSVDIGKGKRSSQLNAKIPTKKLVPETMQAKLVFNLEGQDPIEQSWSFCDALADPMVGKSFVAAGTPKDAFPQECPFNAGDWAISKWDPPTDLIPPGIPDGPISGYVALLEEGKEPCVKVDFEGKLSHGIPMLGR